MYAKHYENPIMLSGVTAKNVGDVFLRHTVLKFAMDICKSFTPIDFAVRLDSVQNILGFVCQNFSSVQLDILHFFYGNSLL